MTDPDLTDDQRRRLWEKQFAGRRIIWSGAVRRLVPEDRRIEFVMSPSLGSGVDVSVAVRTDRGTRNNRIRPGRYFAFSGTLDDYPIPGLEHPVFVRDGEVFTN